MASFDLIYVSAARGSEEALLARLEPLVAELYGTHHLRIERGSGWVQLQREDEPSAAVDLQEMLKELRQRKDHPEWFPPSDKDNACSLSSRLGVDVIYFAAATAADAVQFTRCRGGKVVRNFAYAPEDDDSGWSEEDGEPEPWEKQWARPRAAGSEGPDVTDIGAALGLSGMERSYFKRRVLLGRRQDDWWSTLGTARQTQVSAQSHFGLSRGLGCLGRASAHARGLGGRQAPEAGSPLGANSR